jgi:hypothetical protein
LSYYYIGFPEPLYASSLHLYNDDTHPETEASSYKNNYCECSDQLLLLPPISPKFCSYGNSYSPCGQLRLPQEYEDYSQSQFSKSPSTKIDDYFQLFSWLGKLCIYIYIVQFLVVVFLTPKAKKLK